MRILMISDVHFPRVNGVSTSIQTFRHELHSLGHEITLVALHYPGQQADDTGIKRVAARTMPFDPEDRMMKPGAVRALTRELQSAQYDLVHNQTPFVAQRDSGPGAVEGDGGGCASNIAGGNANV